MSYTNTTTHYSLPQYVATDKPKYLTDFNETMSAIDGQMYTNAQAAATADGKAVAAQATADANTSSIGTLNTQINGDATDPSDLGLAGDVAANTGSINTINSLIGNGTPTTSDKTIIGAINEIYADITGGGTDIAASAVSYDGTTSGLSATNVNAAIDEVAASITTPDAEDVDYDNQTSGLSATNVQAAIDELASASDVTIIAPETKIGTFLGKDLYRKVVTASNPTTGSSIDATLTNSYIDDVVSVNGSYKTSTFTVPISYAGAGNTTGGITFTSSGMITNFQTLTPTEVTVVVEYTKA